MKYDVTLKLHYDYERSAGAGRHLLRVMPAAIPGAQGVEASALQIEPQPDERNEFVDFFGNGVSAIAYREAHETLDVTMKARVSVQRPSRSSDDSVLLGAMPGELAAVLSLEAGAPHHFLAPTIFAQIDPEITAYARASAETATVAALAIDLCNRIHHDFTYDGNATTVRTLAREAFDLKRGVCQDFSHVMIAALRGLGVPAGYVSGFLRTEPPPGKERLEGADAMHAWVRVWCGRDAGWLEIDPTNAMLASDDHIIVGYGRDYADVAPIVGVLRTSGGQALDQAVDVLPLV